MNTAIWNLQNIHIGPVDRPRLQVESLSIPRGVTAVLGKSGAGKTSLLNLLVEFEKPAKGAVSRLLITDEESLPIGWVPPDFGLWPQLTVQQHLAVVASGEDRRVDELLGNALDGRACTNECCPRIGITSENSGDG